MDDVDRRFRHLRYCDRAMHAFGFSERRSRQSVILRRRSSRGECTFDYLVDDDSVLGMHANQTASRTGRTHRSENRSVICKKDSGICHEELETRHTLIHHAIHFFLVTVLELGGDQMESVIDRTLAC